MRTHSQSVKTHLQSWKQRREFEESRVRLHLLDSSPHAGMTTKRIRFRQNQHRLKFHCDRHSECNDRRDVLFGDRKLHQRRCELLLTICLILANELMSLEVKPPLLYVFQNRDEVRLQSLEQLGILIDGDSIGQSSLSTHDVPARCHGWAKMMVCRSKLTNVTLKRRAQGRPARAACHSHEC